MESMFYDLSKIAASWFRQPSTWSWAGEVPKLHVDLTATFQIFYRSLHSPLTVCCCQWLSFVWLLWRHRPQHPRLLCPPLSARICSNSCLWSQWCYLTISSSAAPFSLPSLSPSTRVFSNESTLCIRLPKYCNLSFILSPSNEYSEFISFRID